MSKCSEEGETPKGSTLANTSMEERLEKVAGNFPPESPWQKVGQKDKSESEINNSISLYAQVIHNLFLVYFMLTSTPPTSPLILPVEETSYLEQITL